MASAKPERNQEILRAIDEEKASLKTVAQRFGISCSRVIAIADRERARREHGGAAPPLGAPHPIRRSRPEKRSTWARDREIIEAVASGVSQAEAGRRYNVAASQVSNIIKKARAAGKIALPPANERRTKAGKIKRAQEEQARPRCSVPECINPADVGTLCRDHLKRWLFN